MFRPTPRNAPARGMLLLGLLLACQSPRARLPAAGNRPNIVLIMTDDQGLGDFSHMAHGALETPHIDGLAARSPHVSRFYVSPVCSPTRASLMTGRYNYRTRVVDTWIGRSMMEPEEVTLAEMLRPAGYATGIFGKWHLGDCYPLRPIDQGFEHSLVHRGGGLAQPSEPPENERSYTDAILFENGEQVTSAGYCTDVYFDAALAFIDASVEQDKPFFTYIATNAPHDPFHDVPPELYEKYRAMDLAATLRGKSDKVDREARICAMIENIDQNVGKLLAHLDESGLADDTIIVFLNDNGPLWGRFTAGLRGNKTSVYEGGIRAPLFFCWPGELSASTRVDSIAAHIDITPTLLEAAGVTPAADVHFDGRSLVALLRGEEADWPERQIVLQSHRGDVPSAEHNFALVGQRWKLVRASGFGKGRADEDAPFELFDLATDPGEINDLSAREPQLVRSLRDDYARWFQDVSSTRPDNYAPPAIIVGSDAEPRTVLTRQDWRVPDAQGWSNDGFWKLRAEQRTEFDLSVCFTEERTIDQVVIHTNAGVVERALGATGRRLDLGSVVCAAGAFDLRVECRLAGELVPLHQLTLTTR